MNCPKCNNNMRKGNIVYKIVSDTQSFVLPVYWNSDLAPEKVKVQKSVLWGDRIVERTKNRSETGEINGYCCERCGYIEIYAEKTEIIEIDD